MPGMDTGLEGTRRRYDTSVFEKHTLDSGVTVWLQKPPVVTDYGGVLIAFLPQVGSQMDPANAHGTAHFFEHIPFRGTIGKPTSELLSSPVRSVGGDITAVTSRYWTRYEANLTRENFRLAVETLYEMVVRPSLNDEDVVLERGAILQEHKLRFTNGQSWVQKLIVESFFAPHPMAHMPIGETEVIANMTAQNLREFHESHYHSGNLHLVCGESFTEGSDTLAVISDCFGKLPKRPASQFPGDFSLYFGKSGRVIIEEPRCRRDLLHFAYMMPPRDDDSDHALGFLARFLSNGMHSPLMRELREKRSLIYESGICQITTSRRACTFTVAFPLDRENFDLAESIFKSVLQGLDKDQIRQYQLESQLHRRIEFRSPYSACLDVVDVITSWDRTYSETETDALNDAITVESVLAWRDYLLNVEPFVCEIRA
jgi:zinc protease